MFSYEFVNKGNTTGFRCLDGPYIWIDKEDMTHILSAYGNWLPKDGKVVLKTNLTKETIYLEHYLLNNKHQHIIRIQNNPFDYRKQNLMLVPSSNSSFNIRPSTSYSLSNCKNHHSNQLKNMHIIRHRQEEIGFLSLSPIRKQDYEALLKGKIDVNELHKHTVDYENNEEYYHLGNLQCKNIPILDEALICYYNQLLSNLKLRHIEIKGLVTTKNDQLSLFMQPSSDISSDEKKPQNYIEGCLTCCSKKR